MFAYLQVWVLDFSKVQLSLAFDSNFTIKCWLQNNLIPKIDWINMHNIYKYIILVAIIQLMVYLFWIQMLSHYFIFLIEFCVHHLSLDRISWVSGITKYYSLSVCRARKRANNRSINEETPTQLSYFSTYLWILFLIKTAYKCNYSEREDLLYYLWNKSCKHDL